MEASEGKKEMMPNRPRWRRWAKFKKVIEGSWQETRRGKEKDLQLCLTADPPHHEFCL